MVTRWGRQILNDLADALVQASEDENGIDSVRDTNDHLSDGAARFDVRNRLCGGFERKVLVQGRCDSTLVHERADLLELLAARVHEEVLVANAFGLRETVDLAVE